MGQAILRQAFELWINPEVARRQQHGRISGPFALRAAQIVIKPDGSVPVVRLNDEVQGIIMATPTRAIEAGESVFESDIAEINEVRLTEQDGNAGHITLLRLKDKWIIAFDFRYNRRRIKTTLAIAEEFLVTAKAALEGSSTSSSDRYPLQRDRAVRQGDAPVAAGQATSHIKEAWRHRCRV
jgi:hypothetical protein